MKMKNILYTTFLVFTMSNVIGQDFHLSQYDAAPINFNPALTGLFKGNIRIHGHYRTQWSAIATKPFQTGLISADMPVKGKKLSLGIQIANFRAGAGNYNVFSPQISAAYDFKLDKNNNHHISVGASVGGIQKSVDMSKLTFGDQFSPFNGGGFDNNLPNNESTSANSYFILTTNAGLMYYFGKESARLNPFFGASFRHLNQPKESFYSQDNRLPFHMWYHAGCKVNVNERISFLPKAIFMYQKKASEFTTTVHVQYYLKKSDAHLIFGPTYRNKDAAIIEGGLKYGKFTYLISYDINTSSLKNVTNSRGGLELSVTWINRKIDPNPVKTCPRMF
jgi:type IX secretion system PorP/SprF family membrane protein